MLKQLSIHDFVLVDRLELEFRPGFGALTGETGAGKSILLDALSLVLGERAEGSMVRAGCERADISALFELQADSPANTWLNENDLQGDEQELLLRRTVDGAGRSRAYINGRLANATQLRALSEYVADIHGQHAHHALLRADAQRLLLDSHAGLNELATQVSAAYRAWHSAQQDLHLAQTQQDQLATEHERLSWQAEELRSLNFSFVEWENLNQEQARLAHAASLLEGVDAAANTLYEGDEPLSAVLEKLTLNLTKLSAYDDALKPIEKILDDASVSLQEAGHELRRYRDRLDLDPSRLQIVDERISQILQTARKYRLEPNQLEAFISQTETRLQQLSAHADLQALQTRVNDLHGDYLKHAKQLSAKRIQAAKKLSQAVTQAMQELALQGGSFEVALHSDKQESANGLERIEFLVAANPAQAPRPLAKVASGGELSRIGLAIQVITSAAQATPTLIFDEVDVGIGGRVAEIVGKRLKVLGRSHQVLCVTHLPQVAAQADWQWRIAKQIEGAETLSRVTTLDSEQRIEEIARMLGGEKITATTRSHAAEMLNGH